MLQIYFVCLSYLIIVADIVRCKPDYFFNYEVGGWLKLQTIPAAWEIAMLRCHYEGAVLASPLDTQLDTALHSLMTQSGVNQHIFLGTHDLYSKGDFGSVEEYHLNQRTGSCYKVHQQKQTWVRAYKICASEGGHLVILNDNEEARVVKDMFPVRSGDVNQRESFHVGLRAWGDDRTWITVHGERIEDVFHDWNPGQPDNAGGVQNTGSFIRAGTLDDVWYGYRAMFVCEKSPKSTRFDGSPPGEEELPRL